MSLLGIAAIGGLAMGAASGLAGLIKGGKARREQQALLNKQAASNEAWYQRNYYQNYLDSTEAKSAMKRVEDTLRRRNQQAQAQGAVTGATQEAVLAQQENDQTALADTAERLASKGDAIRRQVDMTNQQNKANINSQQMQQAMLNEQGGQQLLGNAGSLIGSALSAFGAMGGSGSSAGTNTGTSTGAASTIADAGSKVQVDGVYTHSI